MPHLVLGMYGICHRPEPRRETKEMARTLMSQRLYLVGVVEKLGVNYSRPGPRTYIHHRPRLRMSMTAPHPHPSDQHYISNNVETQEFCKTWQNLYTH